MLWRHLFEQHIASPQFINQQLSFERQIYRKVMDCYKNTNIDYRTRMKCAKHHEIKLQQLGIAVQWLIREREKRLESELKECKGDRLLECADKKSVQFVTKYLEKDKKYLQLLRQQLKNQNE